MTTFDFIKASENIKKGTYFKLEYVTKGKDGTYKQCETVVRFITYEPKSENTKNPTGEKISKYVKMNTLKNGETSYTSFFAVSKGKNHKPKVRFFMGDGSEISRAEYEAINPPKQNKQTLEWFSKRIEDIISISQK